MSKLLKILSENADKTPDEIAARLKPKKWIKGATMTQAEYDYLREGEDGRVRLTENQGGVRWWRNGLRDDTNYHMDDWRLSSIRANLDTYYFIRYEDYTDGDLPDPNS